MECGTVWSAAMTPSSSALAPYRTAPARSAPYRAARSARGAARSQRGASRSRHGSGASRSWHGAIVCGARRSCSGAAPRLHSKMHQVSTTSINDQQQQVSRQQPSSQNCSETFSDLTDPCRSPSIALMHAGKSGNAQATGTAVPWDPDGAPCSRRHTKNRVP